MTWEELELIFNRALRFSFSRKKLLFILPVAMACGFITALSRAISYGVSDWIHINFVFLPIFLCGSLLLFSGVVLTRIYHHEVKGLEVNFHQVLLQSRSLFLAIFHLAVPLFFAYTILWMTLGLFYLAKMIFPMSDVMGAVLSFGPFLLVLAALVLSFFNLLLLFFATPQAALKSDYRPEQLKEIFVYFRENPFLTVVFPVLGILPILFAAGLLSLAAVVTDLMYVGAKQHLSVALQWFFMMLPFSILLAPAVVFFFNFAAESYVLIQRKTKKPVKEL
ncbi:MAG TPA: hypothetical protein VLF61_02985 [Rhabdochlamydiaceae bacterium]|nr:hypothetical protein [Rhabdochlamydiaceae bacterium]